jgi:cytochrome c oxidase subunit 2
METVKYGWWLPPDISVHGAGIDHLIIVLHIFMALLFVGWGAFFIYCLVRFRKREGHVATYGENKSKLPKYLEIGVALFEVFLLVGLSFPIWSRYKNQPPAADQSLVVRVIAQQFAWNIHYPGKDGQFGRTDVKLVSGGNPVGLDLSDTAARDDIVTVNQLHIPVHKPVIVHLSSVDVIHSFNVPVLRVKQDMIPGMSIPVWFEATRTGQFDIACAQLCGNGHSLMRGYLTVDTPESFDAWMNEQVQQLQPPPLAAPPVAATQRTEIKG